jgi:hypothetical protein
MQQTDWYYIVLDHLPHPPDHLVEKIDKVYRPAQPLFKQDDKNYLRVDTVTDWKNQEYNWIKPMASNPNVRHRFTSEYENWVRENIIDEFDDYNSGIMFFDTEQLPHTDTTRKYVLLYNVETGGNTTLSFWQEEGHPVFRDPGLAVNRGPHLKLIKSVNGPAKCWYLLDTRVIHSVENMSGLRVNFQVSFSKFPEKLIGNP